MPRERRGANKSKERGEGGPKNKSNASAGVGSANSSQAKRRAVQGCSPSLPDLFPPPLGGPGDHIVANNPFSDLRQSPLAHLPPPQQQQPPQGYPGASPHHQYGPPPPHPAPPGHYSMHPKHVGGGPHGPHGPPMPQGNIPPGGAKIYPPNQSMVFNPSNPNAPPIYPCGICHKEVHDNDQAVLCESGCNFWFHRSCTGLTEAAYQMLTQEVYAEWVCDKCLQTKNIPLVKMKP